jgi:hypothetical protein
LQTCLTCLLERTPFETLVIWRGEESRMTTREALHHLVDQLPEEQVDLARHWLEDLRDAADADGPPMNAAALESLDRGLSDVAEGRVKPLDQYECERGL